MDDRVREQLMAPLMNMVGGKDIWFGKNIPPKKLDGAIKAYASHVNPGNVIALHDSTIFGGAGEGFLVTDAAFYCKGFFGTDTEIRFEKVGEASSPRQSEGQWVTYVQSAEAPSACFKNVDQDPITHVREFFERVVALRDAGAVDAEDRLVIVQDMSEEFRVAYVKMAVCLALADDNEVDATELAEIQLLMTRLELSPAGRRQVWRFLSAPQGTPADVLRELESLSPKGAWPLLVLSLLKDLMGVSRRRQSGEGGARDPFIYWVAQKASIGAEKLAFIEEVLTFDEEVLSGKAKASQVKHMASEVAAKASAVGVPLVAVYLSGSVLGLSAAGITSGLAALGVGGLFGLSSMVTGIGVVVVVGVGIYKLVRWLGGSEEKELAELREHMMQEVMKQLQRTVNALIEDLLHLTQDVVDLTREAAIDEVRLRRLAQEVNALTAALSRLAKRHQPAKQIEATA